MGSVITKDNSRELELFEALKEYADPSLWNEFEKMQDIGEILAVWGDQRIALPDDLDTKYLELEKGVVEGLLTKLRTGELAAYGFKPGNLTRRVRIPRGFWEVVEGIDFPKSKAAGGDREYIGIQITTGGAAEAEQSTIALEKDCEREIKALKKSGYVYVNRKKLHQDVNKRLDAGPISWKGFLRALKGAKAPPEWKKTGPK